MSERNIPIVVDGKTITCQWMSEVFYDGAHRPYTLLQAKMSGGAKYALLLRLGPGDVWVEAARDVQIWGMPSLSIRPDGTAYLSGPTRDWELRIGETVGGWVPRIP